MLGRFFCETCRQVFESDARKIEYTSPVYGPCAKLVANCPVCGADCAEHRVPKPSKSTLPASPPSCGMGGCCCGGH